jgi:hypothetical protein
LPARPARQAQAEEGQQSRAGGQPPGQAIKAGVLSTAMCQGFDNGPERPFRRPLAGDGRSGAAAEAAQTR